MIISLLLSTSQGDCPRDSWIQGGGWDDVAKGAVIGGAFGGGIGALSGAVLGGVNAWAEGKDFWTGKQKMLEFSIEPLEPMPVSCSEANGVISDSKIATFKRNLTPYEKGEIGVRRAIAEFEADGGVVLKREVTVDVNGVRNRFDFVGEKDGVIHLFEVKNGCKALPTKNQSINIPKLMTKEAEFIPVGKNAADINDFKTNVINKTPYKGNFRIVYKHYYE